ncbi:MAG TPA: hypothetical protein VHO91_19585, partial [Rhodopila sp.]|nr:hypothetical protein [Rhodopila sp.]
AGWGAAAAGAAVGATVGVAAGAAMATAAAPSNYAALPAGCIYRPVFARYECSGTWLAPAYGANGVYYRVVAAP